MIDVPKTARIKEVGPREGFQFEKGAISRRERKRQSAARRWDETSRDSRVP